MTTAVELRVKAKPCRYGCGKYIVWDDSIPDDVSKKLKFIEIDSKILHTYSRCAEILKRQGKDVGVLSDKK